MQIVDDNGNPIQEQDSKRVVAGILAIILGCLGVHKFILGYTTEGVIILLISVIGFFITCGLSASAMGVLGLIEGIVYLTKTDEEFIELYQLNKKPWF